MVFGKRKNDEEKSRPPAPEPGAAGPATAPEGVVESYTAQAQAATRLAGVDVRHLQSWQTNPRTLADLEQARDAAHREAIGLWGERERINARAEHARARDTVERDRRWAQAAAAREDRAIGQGMAEADEAAADVEAITQARSATRPATAATRLARSQSRIAGAYLVGGAAGSVMSAVGIAAAVHAGTAAGLWAAAALAAVVEVPTTLLASGVIWSQGHIARNTRTGARVEPDGTRVRLAPQVPAWAGRLPRIAVALLLAVSVSINAWGVLGGASTGVLGVMGMVGAGIAALASLLGWAYSVQSAAVIAANMTDASVAGDLAERRRTAAGAYIPTRHTAAEDADTGQEQELQVPQRPGQVDAGTAHAEHIRRIMAAHRSAEVDRALEDPDVTDTLFSSITRGLGGLGDDGEDDGPGGGGVGGPPPAPPSSGPGAARVQGQGSTPGTPLEPATDQGGSAAGGPVEGSTPGTPLEPGRDQAGQAGGGPNRTRVLEAIRRHGAGVANRALERELGLSRTAVRNHRNALAEQGHPVYLPTQPSA
ncbi:hypothetical protein EMG21_27900 [Klebsiella pneumoniae]|nr:hypothetical protein EMG21_27900 [Klebsiella pneumoniae]